MTRLVLRKEERVLFFFFLIYSYYYYYCGWWGGERKEEILRLNISCYVLLVQYITWYKLARGKIKWKESSLKAHGWLKLDRRRKEEYLRMVASRLSGGGGRFGRFGGGKTVQGGWGGRGTYGTGYFTKATYVLWPYWFFFFFGLKQ